MARLRLFFLLCLFVLSSSSTQGMSHSDHYKAVSGTAESKLKHKQYVKKVKRDIAEANGENVCSAVDALGGTECKQEQIGKTLQYTCNGKQAGCGCEETALGYMCCTKSADCK